MKAQAVLVGGGLGFVGSAVSAQLLEDGHRVTVVSRTPRSAPPRLLPYLGDNLRIITHDLRKPLQVQADLIFNFASPAAPESHLKNPVGTILDNIMAATSLLDSARENMAPIFQASTCDVYGYTNPGPISEHALGQFSHLSPRASYVESKKLVETLFQSYQTQYKVDARVGRLFSTYGPGMQMRDGRLISNLIMAALRNLDIHLVNKGKLVRSFLFVEDASKAIVKVMRSNLGTAVNIGSARSAETLEVAELVVALTKSRSKIKLLEGNPGVPIELVPDLGSISSTGWAEELPLQEGLERTIEDFRRRISQQS